MQSTCVESVSVMKMCFLCEYSHGPALLLHFISVSVHEGAFYSVGIFVTPRRADRPSGQSVPHIRRSSLAIPVGVARKVCQRH